MIKISKKDRERIEEQKRILKQRIEREHNKIPFFDMIGILDKVENRFNIMLEEVFVLE